MSKWKQAFEMTSWAIVAIPAESDPVWKLSSEKIPHMTILFLGEQNDALLASHITSFVEHTAKMVLQPFGMAVDYRGVLGPYKADVLFFEKEYTYTDVVEFRKYLLADSRIRAAYDSVDQYPEWTPHLTLGYPESPAKKNVLDYPISYVHFDKIALWTEDFGGVEIPLKHRPLEVVMSDKMTVEDALEHFGVKGMRWGVRKATTMDVRRSVQSPNLSAKNKKILKTTAKVAGSAAIVAGSAAAAYVLGKNKGTSIANIKHSRAIELGQATVSKSMWNLVRTGDFGTMDASMVDYIMRDTFKNRL